jgi:hypothetical protein
MKTLKQYLKDYWIEIITCIIGQLVAWGIALAIYL